MLRHLASLVQKHLQDLSNFNIATVRPYVSVYVDVLDMDVPGARREDLVSLGEELANCLRGQAFHLYTSEVSHFLSAESKVTDLRSAAGAIGDLIRTFKRRFAKPLMG